MQPQTNSPPITSMHNSYERYGAFLLQSTIPLFGNKSGKRPKLFGTGFFVSTKNSIYLISAAHVLDNFKELYFYISPSKKRKLTGKLILTKPATGTSRNEDKLDIAILRLEGVGLPPYPELNKYPIPISTLLPHAIPRENKQYIIVGFPATRSHANPSSNVLEAKAFSYSNVSSSLDVYSRMGVSPRTHIAISFDRNNVYGQDGSKLVFPDPHGMSGSPVWLLFDEKGINEKHFTPVVGVVVEYHRNEKVIIATDIAHALGAINEVA
jgi:hypothetical protein